MFSFGGDMITSGKSNPTHELSTGYHMSYASDTFFRQIPEADRIVA